MCSSIDSAIKVLYVFIIVVFFLLPQQVSAAVVINEFQLEPSGASQWAEILNTGPDSVNISGWFIDDNGGSEKYTIPSGSIISANTCISFQSGNFNWNTASSDSARLLNGLTVVDEYSFSESPGSGVSYGRSPDGTGSFTTFTSPTRDKVNSTGQSCLAPPTPTPTPTSTPTPTLTPTPTPTPGPTVTPTPTPTKTPTPTPTRTLTPAPTLIELPPESTATVLGAKEDNPEPEEPRPIQPFIISLLLISFGLAILSLLLLVKKLPKLIKHF